MCQNKQVEGSPGEDKKGKKEMEFDLIGNEYT